MYPFQYVRAQDQSAAIKQVSGTNRASFVAGGTGLLDLMKLDVETPAVLVDVNRLPLKKIEVTEKGVRVGALVSNSDLAYHDVIRQRYPVLSEALLSGASPQLRNMATVGGNLMQRTRCYYFRDTSCACNKRQPGSGCSAQEGYNRIHAVLGTSDKCIAAHPSDMCVALAALDAVIKVRGPKAERAIPLTQFYLLPGDTPDRETLLEREELIVAVELPNLPFAVNSHYLKVRDRASYEFALVSVAAALEVTDSTIRQARLALGGVGTIPWRCLEAEKTLVGAKVSEAAFAAAADAALKGAKSHKDNAFKVELARRAVVRALTKLASNT